jgi:hypothetical protein
MGLAIRAYAKRRGVTPAAVRKALRTGRIVADASDEAAWWKPDYPTPPGKWSAKERTAFTVRRMQFHLVHEETPRDDERVPDTTPQLEVVQSRLTLKRQREQRRTDRRVTRRP